MNTFSRITENLVSRINFPALFMLALTIIAICYILFLYVYRRGIQEGEDLQCEKEFNMQNNFDDRVNEEEKILAEKDPSVQITSNGIRKVIINCKAWKTIMLSDFGFQVLKERGCFNDKICAPFLLKRDDPRFVSALEEYGKELTGEWEELKIVEIPSDVKWELVERNGMECIEEVHRVWR